MISNNSNSYIPTFDEYDGLGVDRWKMKNPLIENRDVV